MQLGFKKKKYDHFEDMPIDEASREPSDLVDAKGNDSGRAYILALMEVAADDARNLVLVATVAVGAVVFLANDLADPIAGLDAAYRLCAGVAMILLLIGAACLYWYAAEVNERRMAMARCLASGDAAKVRKIWVDSRGIKAERGLVMTLAIVLLVIASFASLLVMWELFTQGVER